MQIVRTACCTLRCPNLRLSAFHHCHQAETCSHHTRTKPRFLTTVPFVPCAKKLYLLKEKNIKQLIYNFDGLRRDRRVKLLNHSHWLYAWLLRACRLETSLLVTSLWWTERQNHSWHRDKHRINLYFPCYPTRTETLKMAGARIVVGLTWRMRWELFLFCLIHQEFRF